MSAPAATVLQDHERRLEAIRKGLVVLARAVQGLARRVEELEAAVRHRTVAVGDDL